jgi:hypothetical protein
MDTMFYSVRQVPTAAESVINPPQMNREGVDTMRGIKQTAILKNPDHNLPPKRYRHIFWDPGSSGILLSIVIA